MWSFRSFGSFRETLLLLDLLTSMAGFVYSAESTLEFVQIFFRHGQRTPTHFMSFPTEPPGTDRRLPYEFGELTNTGMWQVYSLGANLRDEYAALINHRYRPSQLRVLTGVDNRTVTSAQLALASFLPPIDDQIWNPALRWQPIPTVTEEILDHVSFGSFNHCGRLKAEILNGDEYWKIFDSVANLTNYLEKKTGVEIPDLYVLQRVIDALINRDTLRDFVPYPKWADNQHFIDTLRQMQYNLHVDFMSIFIDGIGGWHYDQILGGIVDFINNRSNHRIVFYSGHDTNTVTLTQFLRIDMDLWQLPNFGSFLAFETHRMADNGHELKVFFHNELNKTKHRLRLADCPAPCRVEQFADLGYRRLSSVEWLAICRGNATASSGSYYKSLSAVLLIAAIILACCLLSAVWSCLSYRKKFNQLNDMELFPLL